MIIAAGTFELHFPEVHTLKEKRQVLRCLLDRVRAKFSVSIAEVEYNDLWQRSVIGVAIVSNDRTHLEQMGSKIEEIIQSHDQATMINREWEFL
ncbi:MAG: DUF503 domain-containing protein [Candidatus Riflebacteria bacterium]|nr:DUF503 domain-containing protein [Candidatus Riflebacteria bacterium]